MVSLPLVPLLRIPNKNASHALETLETWCTTTLLSLSLIHNVSSYLLTHAKRFGKFCVEFYKIHCGTKAAMEWQHQTNQMPEFPSTIALAVEVDLQTAWKSELKTQRFAFFVLHSQERMRRRRWRRNEIILNCWNIHAFKHVNSTYTNGFVLKSTRLTNCYCDSDICVYVFGISEKKTQQLKYRMRCEPHETGVRKLNWNGNSHSPSTKCLRILCILWAVDLLEACTQIHIHVNCDVCCVCMTHRNAKTLV